jgi:putative hydrolase of the HAD superfamily
MAANSLRAVYFDAVGTLLTPADPVAATYRAAALRFGLDLDEATIRSRVWEAFEKQERLDHQQGWQASEAREAERWRSVIQETLRELADPSDCFHWLWEWYRSPDAWTVHPEAAGVLAELAKRGLIVGLASNFDARLGPIVAAKPELGLLKERCAISSLVGWRKPSEHFFREVVHRAGCAAAEILYVGDDVRNDYKGARAAGLRSILFDPADKSQEAERILSFRELLVGE